MSRPARLSEAAGVVVREFQKWNENSNIAVDHELLVALHDLSAVYQATCDHKFVDSTLCLKCGWKPDPQGIRRG